MASVATSEKWASINGDDALEGIEISEIDSAFLVSLMEELQDHVEESDEKRLRSVIQSLEAEINYSSTSLDDLDSCMEPADDPNHQSTGDGEDGHDCLALFDHDLDMNVWIDMEAVPCSPSHALNNWDTFPCEDEMSSGCFVHEYTNNLGVALDQEYGYNSL
ncbi:hypothetical protein TIFTF001_026921 [Ficus carica]|uniref:Uncharacterized protein n=1 Tax=Ficus carica TaxID=3494 RepID=A0AA88DM32_FICCA|nr:hypothetical protein TIFTF001_026921 [Ficus carica]